jgi:protein-tyrosine phosphatase
MEIAEIKDGLFQSSAYTAQDFDQLKKLGIEVVIDLEGGFDPQYPALTSYLFWPIKDVPWLPDKEQLYNVGCFAHSLWRILKKRVLVHCAQGYNRSGLVNGVILNVDGMPGVDAVKLIREKRPGALFNLVFANYLESLK